jgi:membrane-bound lytic murein transglycosylase D
MSARAFLSAGCAVLAVWLAGCAPTSPVAAPADGNPQATAPTLPAPAPKAPPSNAQAVTREQQHVRILIQQVEQAYARGESDYRKGRLAEARAEFDLAVDLMLQSGLDIKNTPQLQDEFDRTLDQVNGLEMEALKRGNGFTPQEEEAPADVAADVTFKVDPNFVAKAQADLATTKSDLPLVVNDYVAAFINFFANTKKGHNTLLHSFQRGGRYHAMIQRVMAEEGVPQDLIYLAVAESGFNPRALNAKSHAGGMWQFMPYGNYGLAHNAYVDERFDPEKSTRAYARYMKFIYEQTGDWYLSMAGYDWGTGNVQRAVQKTGYADFWELYKRHNLPAETANYVPEILAAIIIANHPTQYGFDDITLDPPVLTDTVTINYSIDLRLVSDLVGAPIDEMEALNPSLLRRLTPPDTSFDLHLPAGTATLFDQRVAAIPEAHRNAWRYRRVKADDTVASVAREFHVSESELLDANHLHEGDDLKNVEALVIPAAPAPAPVATRAQLYTARKGDTLVTIADRFGVSLTQLRHWNKLSGTGVKVELGRKLHVSEPTVARRATSGRKHSATASSEKSASATSEKKESAPRTAKGRKKASTAREPHAASAKTAPAAKKQSAHKPASKRKSSKEK